jgi:opacity protein-like surface antigen
MQTYHFTPKELCLFLAILGLVNVSQAQSYETPPPPRPISSAATETGTSSSTVMPGKDGRLQISTTNDAPQPQAQGTPYMLKAEPRAPLTGYNVAVFGGINVAQEGDIETFGGLPTESDSEIAAQGGLKLGYIWPFSDEPLDQFELETSSVGGVKLSGGLEAEAFYVGNRTELSTSAGVTKFDMDMGFLMLNATLQAQWGKFRIYGGPGVGLAVIGSENDTQAELAYEILGGMNYFFAPDWSIFGEYKYLIIDHLVVTTPAGNADFDQFGQHLISLGLRKHF